MASRDTLEVSPELEGQTLAALVRRLVPDASWSRARELCTSGRVVVDGARALDPAERVALGRRVEVAATGRRHDATGLADEDVLSVDDDVVVVRKHPGVLTCPYEDGDRDTLADRVRAWLKRTRGGRDPMVGVVQRLDKDTTGALVFARNMRSKRALEEQLRAHTVVRRYLALAHGVVRSARIESEIVQNRGDGLRGSWGARPQHRGPPPPEAKRCVTHVTALEPLARATLVGCRLETGRQHQIRIHLSEAGHPLVGETVYIRDFGPTRIEAPRPMLHAVELGFLHPRSHEPVHFVDPPPRDFEACLAGLRLAHPATRRD